MSKRKSSCMLISQADNCISHSNIIINSSKKHISGFPITIHLLTTYRFWCPSHMIIIYHSFHLFRITVETNWTFSSLIVLLVAWSVIGTKSFKNPVNCARTIVGRKLIRTEINSMYRPGDIIWTNYRELLSANYAQRNHLWIITVIWIGSVNAFAVEDHIEMIHSKDFFAY